MYVEIGNKAVQFLIWKYMFRIFGTVYMLLPGAQAARRRRL
jgi:hypothetical protein